MPRPLLELLRRSTIRRSTAKTRPAGRESRAYFLTVEDGVIHGKRV